MASPINELIDEFNSTVGQKEGIQITVTSASNSNKIHNRILAAANNEPGAPDLPDIFNCYPKTVSAMQDSDMLVDYRDYFSDEELSCGGRAGRQCSSHCEKDRGNVMI